MLTSSSCPQPASSSVMIASASTDLRACVPSTTMNGCLWPRNLPTEHLDLPNPQWQVTATCSNGCIL